MTLPAEGVDRKAVLRQALAAVAEMQARLEATERSKREPIAIVGTSCRLPGGIETPERLWEVLRDGTDAVSEVPADRWDIDAYYDPDPSAPGKMCTRRGGFMTQVDRFDPQFFGIAPREALSMDPQQRLLLEVSWEALERSGQAPDRLTSSLTGVFVGITTSDYAGLIDFADPKHSDVYAATGNALNAAAGRLSFTLGLQGPCMAVDTACSSSLVALHLACLSLRARESDLALAAGVNVILAPETFVLFSKWGMLAGDGRCKTFDAAADGFVRGEGCVAVVLKRLSDAVADGDDVLAVIRGSAVNQDGRSSGLTVPNGPAQQEVIRRALAAAALQPADVDYVEAHGTGTPLGDPIEVEALAGALGARRETPLAIGSIKTNIGHVEAASGLAGLLKVVLALRHGSIPRHLHFERPNPRIAWDDIAVKVASEPIAWPRGGRRRIAGVSSFGFSGTNAHVILEEAPLRAAAAEPGAPSVHVLTMSAKTAPALEALAGRYAEYLTIGSDESIGAACFTANAGRAQFNHRLAVIGASREELEQKLSSFQRDSAQATGIIRGQATGSEAPRVAFLFTGQGSQYPGMGRGLYESEPVFRAAMDRCAEHLQHEIAVPLLDVLYGTRTELLGETAYTQPALFAVEYALAQLWRSWGVVPGVVLGHSVGEYVAACVAGIVELDDALRLIAARGRLMQALPGGGAMAAIFAGLPVVAPVVEAIGGSVAIAAVNGPDSTVVSGTQAAVEAVIDRLVGQGIRAQRLAVSHAFHSPLMDPMLDEFEKVAATVRYHAPQIGLVSNETGRWVRAGEIDAAYWRRHVRAAVQFERSIAEVRAKGYEIFLEAGPAPTLLGLGRRCIDGGTWVPSLRPGRSDRAELLTNAATLYVQGLPIDWAAITQPGDRRHVTLPTYPFQRERFWVRESSPAPESPRQSGRRAGGPLVGHRLSSPLAEIQFECELTAGGWLAEHVIRGVPVFPATGHMALARQAAGFAFGPGSHELFSIDNHEPLVLSASAPRRVQTILQPAVDGLSAFRILSQQASGEGEAHPWQLHVSGSIRIELSARTIESGDALADVRARCTEGIPVGPYYDEMRVRGLEYGAQFRGVTELWAGQGEAIGRVELPGGAREADGQLLLHPALLDSCFHVIGHAMDAEARAGVYLPVGTDRVSFGDGATGPVWSQAVVRESPTAASTLVATVRLFDEQGRLTALVDGLKLKRMSGGALARWASRNERQFLHRIEWMPESVVSSGTAGEPGTWLLFADRLGVAEAFGRARVAAGDDVVFVSHEGQVSREGDLTIDAGRADAYVEVLQGRAARLRGVMFAWALDQTSDDADATRADAALAGCRGLLHVVQALARIEALEAPRLVLVTRGAVAVSNGETPVVEQAPLAGFLRSASREHPRLRCLALDLDPEGDAGEATRIVADVTSRDAEEDVVYRGGSRFVRRLLPAGDGSADRTAGSTSGAKRLRIVERGVLDNLRLEPADRRAPERGEVEIAVRAAGLNFRDVLNVLGMYPGDPGPLGSDCAGVVTRVGAGVSHLQAGDEVVGLVTDCFGSFVTGPAAMVQRKPVRCGFADAVTIPNAFLTAQYALEHIGGMSRGERVLIHAAAGGVGSAAVQLAQAAGAEVFATAGSARKRAFLSSLGIAHVMDSRSTEFAGEIAARTAGQGVHVVLNSLSGASIAHSLAALVPGGRFVEIGKNGIWSAEEVARVRPDVRYSVIDLGEAIQRDEALVQRLFADLLARFEAGTLSTLPTEQFPLADAVGAFRHMAAARHIGKIVLLPPVPREVSEAEVVVSPDSTYLVTGGFGGLGLVVARWLVERGAKRLVLAGRRRPSGAACDRVAELQSAGAEIVEAIGDVSSAAFVSGTLAAIAASGAPLRGIVHAAGVVRDAPVDQMAWPQYLDVWSPKAAGAWNLHSLTAGVPLDFFVLFSSASGVLGSPGQANYAAANSFLDALAYVRRAHGLPAVSINWGPWSDVGMAAGLGTRERERWAGQGIGTIAPDQGLRALEHAMRQGEAQIGVLAIDWRKFLTEREARGDLPLLREIARSLGVPDDDDRQETFGQRLASADAQDRHELLLEHVREAVGRVLAIDPASLPDTQGLTDIGMDSLMAVELSNRLTGSLGRPLPPTLAFEHPTIAALGAYLGALLGIAPAGVRVPERTTVGDDSDLVRDVIALTEDEVALSLAAELEQAGYEMSENIPKEASAASADLSPLKRALVAIKDLRAKLDASDRARHEPIAIVGMGCRFPGSADSVEGFWTLLKDGVDAIGPVPPARWDAGKYYDPNPDAPGKTSMNCGGFLDGAIEGFDAGFFNIAAREAVRLDPQQRLLLEVSWEALEEAGIAPASLHDGMAGVFFGVSTSDYKDLQQGSGVSQIDAYLGTGSAACVAAGRVSYFLGLHGPAMAVDTACSSSLVAIDLAVQALRNGKCPIALAGGVNLMLAPETAVYLSKVRALGADGRCKAFDEAADGYGRGEGCGVIVLKRLADALADGDRIVAVIRGSAINHDGRSSGLTVPNGAAQQAVIEAALADGRLDPAQVAYVEAHGTGTPLGDPIELRALGAVLGQGRQGGQKLLVGTAKTNIGHLEAAAGVAGLIKVALALKHRWIPPNLHLRTPSSRIPWSELSLGVPVEGQPWPEGSALIAGVSSFGFSGTNAHIILEAAPALESAPEPHGAQPAPVAERPLHLLPLSARSSEVLDRIAARYGAALSDDVPAADACFTAAAGRSHFEERLAVIGASTADLRDGLAAFAGRGEGPRIVRGRAPARAPKIAFMFTGQGSQYLGMGRELYDTQPAFRASLDRCQALLAGELDTPLLDVMFAAPDGAIASERLTQTRYTQPALFAIEYSLAELWKSWGIVPAAVIGHSVGEYAAACIAGVLTLEDAIRLVAARGRLMQSLPAGGGMAAIFADEQAVSNACAAAGGHVSIAAINGPAHFVVAGAAADVDRTMEHARAAGARAERLHVSHAFHSELMEPMLDEFERVAATVSYARPRIRLISNVTGAPTDAVTTPRYWRDHVRQSVRFADGVRALCAQGFDLFVEVGPQPVLSGLTAACVPAGSVTCLPSLRRGKHDWTQMLETLAGLYVRGASIDWRGYERAYDRHPLALPTYPFERERYWIDPQPDQQARSAGQPSASGRFAGHRVRSPLTSDIVFHADVSTATLPFLADHVIYGTVLVPAAALLDLALSAAASAFSAQDRRVERFAIQEALVLNEGETRVVQTVLTQPQGGSSSLTIYSTPAGETQSAWTIHATGQLRLTGSSAPLPMPSTLADIAARCPSALSADEFYAGLREGGIAYGPAFRGIQHLQAGNREALARIAPQAAAGAAGDLAVHPALLDTCFQVLGAACAAALGDDESEDVFLPVAIDTLRLSGEVRGPVWSYASLRPLESGPVETITADLWWVGDDGTPLLQIEGFTAKRARRAALQRTGRRDLDRWFHEIDWRPAEPVAPGAARPSRRWIVLADGAGANLASKLRSLGDACVLAVPGEGFEMFGDEMCAVNPLSRFHLRQLLDRWMVGSEPCGIVHMLALPGDGALAGSQDPQRMCESLLALTQALADVAHPEVRLWTVTSGAQPVDSALPVDPSQAALWGLAGVVAAEHPALMPVRIDLDPAASGQIERLTQELAGDADETQVALRGDQRFVARLVTLGAVTGRTRLPIPAGESWKLTIPQRGTIDHLVFESARRREPGAGEIELRVHSTGLNFRDVLNVLGMYPGDPGPLGSECSGRVTAVGEGVTAFAPGDDVMCMGGGSFGPYFTVSTGLVMPKPVGLTHQQAAGVPIAFLTALHGLTHLGRMKAGDRVLIHAAAGGVGMAAVQLALRAGAEVFGTVGSAAKRRVLESMGVHHVLNSRTLDFADEITTITGGRGVDIVLNSLTGEFITKSLSILAPGGRFLEIGKADIRTAEQIAQVNPHVSYDAFDLGEVVLRDPVLASRLYAELLDGLGDGTLRALPARVFPIEEAPAAFRFMAQARHIGKVVVSQPEAPRTEWQAEGQIFRADGAYLITGGLGALGLSVAGWMVDRGARHVFLTGRSDPSVSARQEIASLERRGATVRVVAGDVSRESDVRRVLDQVIAAGRPLRGVFHAAGVLKDGVLADQRWEDVEHVLAPKILGASILDRLTRSHPIEHFVLFSSVSSVLGSPGQGGYAAGNAFMDGLAHQRQAIGLPGQSINWGPWADRGMAAGLSSRDRDRMAATGFDMIPTVDGLACLERAIGSGRPQLAVVPARWEQVCGRFASGQLPPLFRVLATADPAAGRAAAPAGVALKAQLDAAPDSEKKGIVVVCVRGLVARALGLTSGGSLPLRTPFTELGLDSLMAVELRNALGDATGLPLPASLIYDHACIEHLADHIGGAMLGTLAGPATAATEEAAAEPLRADLDDLSDDELAGLLAAGMASLNLEER